MQKLNVYNKNYFDFEMINKTNKMTCAPSEDSDQPGPLASLVRVFAVHKIKSKDLKSVVTTVKH